MKLTRKRNGKIQTIQAESPTLVTRLKSEGWKPVAEKVADDKPEDKGAGQARGNAGGKA